jgi:predicted permease
VFIIIAIAYGFGRVFTLDSRALSAPVIYIFIPALVLRTLIRTEVAVDQLLLMGVSVLLMTVGIFFVAVLLARLLRLDPVQTTAFLVCVVMVNASNYGIPVNTFAFGALGTELATLYYLLTVVIGNNAGIFIASHDAGGVRRAFDNMLRVPVLPATVVGIALNVFNVPLPLDSVPDRVLSVLGSGAVPMMLVIMGVRLAAVRPGKNLVPALGVALLRLVVAPLIIYGLGWLFGLRDLTLTVTVLQTAMPSAVMSTAVTQQFGNDEQSTIASEMVLVSTVLSLITVSVWLTLLA